MWRNPPNEEIAALLRRSTKIAVVGLSPNPLRPSHDVARYLKAAGFEITGVRPGRAEILGEPCYPALLDIPEARRPDIVNIFRRADQAGVHVREAMDLGLPAIWMQLGVIDEKAAEAAAARGILVVMDRCIAVDHRRLR